MHSTTKMPQPRVVLALLGAALISTAAQAEDDCTMQFSQQKLDYGSFTRSELQTSKTSSGLLSMGKRTFSLSSTCGAGALIGVTFNANSHDENGYRFAQNGLFTLKIIDAQLDGRTVQMRPSARIASGAESGLLRPGDYLVPHDGQTPALGERLNLQIEAHALLTEDDVYVSSNETKEGNGEFVVKAM